MSLRTLVFAALGAALLLGCPAEDPHQPPPPDDAGVDALADAGDAGDTSGPLLEAQLLERAGTLSEPIFEPFDGESTLEIVSGPQGGFHVELALRLEEPSEDSFITLMTWQMSDADTGEVLSQQPSSLRIDEHSWQRGDDGELLMPRHWLVLDVVDAADVEGRSVQIDVDVEVEGGLGHGSDSVEAELVDEVEEAMPG